MGPKMQAQLLRTLQDGEVRPVGGSEAIRVDVRLVCATNKDLDDEVKAGRFREDLYFRINVVTVAAAAAARAARGHPDPGRPLPGQAGAGASGASAAALSPEALKLLSALRLARQRARAGERDRARGGGRQGERRAAVGPAARGRRRRGLAGGGRGRRRRPGEGGIIADRPTLAELERRYIQLVLAESGGNKKKAAEKLGIDRRTLYRALERDRRRRQRRGRRLSDADASDASATRLPASRGEGGWILARSEGRLPAADGAAAGRVSKRYGAGAAVDGIDLTFASGKTTALLGPSGCGKSTVLRLLLALVTPDAGQVAVDGRPLPAHDIEALRRRIGYVIQDGGLFPHLTAAENVTLMARHLRLGRRRAPPSAWRSCATLTRFPADALARYPNELSGGQAQRVAIMRALMLDPEVLLLDEPLSRAGSAGARRAARRSARHLPRRSGKTVIVVTHDVGEAAHLADVVVLMRDGRVVQQGRSRRSPRAPADAFVTPRSSRPATAARARAAGMTGAARAARSLLLAGVAACGGPHDGRPCRRSGRRRSPSR